MALHVKPDDAVAEIDALADVYDLAVQYFNDEVNFCCLVCSRQYK